MRIANFSDNGRRRLGFIEDDMLIDPLAAGGDADLFSDTLSFLRAGDQGREVAAAVIAEAPDIARQPLSAVRLLAPMVPTTILCAGSNYQAHNAEKANAPLSGKEPEFFVKTADCVIGPEEPILHDTRLTSKLDCETELAVVIGKPGRHIPVESADEHIWGFTIANDVTARDRQVRRSPEGFTWYELGRGKVFDSSLPLGPVIVDAQAFGDPRSHVLRTRINGELRQQASIGDMIWSCADLVHFFSINLTLRPGMIILTGTPAGTAWSADTDLGGNWHPAPGLIAASRYCEPRDVVESEIDGIGVLRNPVEACA